MCVSFVIGIISSAASYAIRNKAPGNAVDYMVMYEEIKYFCIRWG